MNIPDPVEREIFLEMLARIEKEAEDLTDAIVLAEIARDNIREEVTTMRAIIHHWQGTCGTPATGIAQRD